MKITPTKRFLILTLSFLVMLNSVGVFVITYIETGFHRASVYADNSNDNSNLLSLNSNQFKSISWIGERDFIYNGNVYDCDKIYAANGKINLQCRADSEETNLKNNLSKSFDDGNKNVPASKSVKDFFKIFPVFKNDIAANNLTSAETFSIHFSSYNKQLPLSVDLPLNSPPPKFS